MLSFLDIQFEEITKEKRDGKDVKVACVVKINCFFFGLILLQFDNIN